MRRTEKCEPAKTRFLGIYSSVFLLINRNTIELSRRKTKLEQNRVFDRLYTKVEIFSYGLVFPASVNGVKCIEIRDLNRRGKTFESAFSKLSFGN